MCWKNRHFWPLLKKERACCLRAACGLLYHNGCVPGPRNGHGHVEIEAVFVHFCVGIPHFGPGKAFEHGVDGLDTRVGPFLCFLNARPPRAKGENEKRLSIEAGILEEENAENDIRFFLLSPSRRRGKARS